MTGTQILRLASTASDGEAALTMGCRHRRRLAAVLMADAVAYTQSMQQDEAGVLNALQQARAALARICDRRGGRIAGDAGDSILAEFPSVLTAVEAGVEFQTSVTEPQSAHSLSSSGPVLRFRIGIHLGDVIASNGTILGDAVNLAARLQSAAVPGGILVSATVYEQVNHKLQVGFKRRGQLRFKNLPKRIECFDVTWQDATSSYRRRAAASFQHTSRRIRLLAAFATSVISLTVVVAAICAIIWLKSHS